MIHHQPDPPLSRSDSGGAVRVAVFGAAGRMGATVCHALAEHHATTVVAAVSPRHAGQSLATVVGAHVDVTISGSVDELEQTAIDVVVDFSRADAARSNLAWCASRSVHAVVGTTGLTDADLKALHRRFSSSACLVAPNFAIGAVLMLHFARLAAPFFETCEIVDLHHDKKVDAPSGTAVLMAEWIASAAPAGRTSAPATTSVLPHVRGGSIGPGGVPIHSIRLRGLVGHQYALFGTSGQTLTIRHDSYDRSSFMPGMLLGVETVRRLPAGLTVGLEPILGIPSPHQSSASRSSSP